VDICIKCTVLSLQYCFAAMLAKVSEKKFLWKLCYNFNTYAQNNFISHIYAHRTLAFGHLLLLSSTGQVDRILHTWIFAWTIALQVCSLDQVSTAKQVSRAWPENTEGWLCQKTVTAATLWFVIKMLTQWHHAPNQCAHERHLNIIRAWMPFISALASLGP
jgi:hypothetical protein